MQLNISDLNTHSASELSNQQLELLNLLISRDSEFKFNPEVIVHYPTDLDSLLNTPLNYVNKLISDNTIGRIVILTTYGNKIIESLVADEFIAHLIDMPAGPDNTYWLEKQINAQGKTLYIEAVNESNEKIKPNFIITLLDDANQLLGGISGTIHTHNHKKYAYISITVTNSEAPKGTGSKIMHQAIDYLSKQRVYKIHLGTQTADRFYIKNGFSVTHRLIEHLRNRQDKQGNTIIHPLVMMEKNLAQ